MNLIEVSWKQLESSMLAKGLATNLQWVTDGKAYTLFLFDGPMNLTCQIPISKPPAAAQFEFESKYKAKANSILEPLDTDNSILSRVKITKSGWAYQYHALEFETAKLNSIVNLNINGTPIGYATEKFYKANGDLIATPTQELLDAECVTTIIDWEPTHDYEIMGGVMRQMAVPTEAVRLWVVGVPDVPKAYGGSKEFTKGGVNLQFFGVGDSVKADGKTPKFLKYDANYHSNKLRLILKSTSAGYKHKVLMVFEVFVP